MTDRIVLLLLLGGCVLFGAIVYAEVEAGGAAGADVSGIASRPEATAVAHARQSPKLDELVATALARPLFSSTRRPPQNAVAGGPSDGDFTDKRLTGIVITPGQRIAIFAVTGDKPLKVSEGEDVSGWRVDNITLREVSLSGPGGTKVLQPKLDPNLVQQAPQPALANIPGRPPLPTPGMPRAPGPLPVPTAGRPNPAVPVNTPGAPPRPARPRQQR